MLPVVLCLLGGVVFSSHCIEAPFELELLNFKLHSVPRRIESTYEELTCLLSTRQSTIISSIASECIHFSGCEHFIDTKDFCRINATECTFSIIWAEGTGFRINEEFYLLASFT